MSFRENIEELDSKNKVFLKRHFKDTLKLFAKSLFLGGLLRYILYARGFETMVLVGIVIIVFALKK